MSKHTPGPWTVNETGRISAGDIEIGHAFEYELDYSDYCDCHADCTNPPLPRLANARLMAAAPELLEFVRYVAKGIPVWDDPCSLEESVDHLEERAKRLVSKIEGDE